MNQNDEVKVGWKGYAFSAKGQTVILLLLSSLAVVFLEYQSRTRADEGFRQHESIVSALQLQTCIQSVPFEERRKLREDLVKSPSPIQTLRLGWCPWIDQAIPNDLGRKK